MSLPQGNDLTPSCPEASDNLRQQAHRLLDQILDACQNDHSESSFFLFEKALQSQLATLGLLLMRLFLLVRHQRLDSTTWSQRGYRVGQSYAPRNLQTTCGSLRYGRDYLIPRQGKAPGVHPLDVELGLSRDSFTPLVISWFCRLCTRLSFRVACDVGEMFLDWTPAVSTVEEWVLGLGRPAYVWLSSGPLPKEDGEVLVIECDGKAIPTATQEELDKRRKPRPCQKGCQCQRHRGRSARKARGPKKKRKRGDKSKNGRSATLVVMYTLKQGEDGRLHGPVNKKVFASFSSRRKVLTWARQQATRRGFPPKTTTRVQLIVDGELCLEKQLRKLFPRAILTLDIHHAQEYLWRIGRLVYAEGSEALTAWIEPMLELLYQGNVGELLKQLGRISFAGPGSKAKRKKHSKALTYLQKREQLMDYGKWREQDLVLASGIVEGAARQVVGERLDLSGMRWVVERAEAVLLLRCVEINGDWEDFFAWSQAERTKALKEGKPVQIRSKTPTQQPTFCQASEKRRKRRKAATVQTQMQEAA